MTPSQRSTRYLQDQGWTCWKCEYWCSFSKRRKDLFGFVDIFAMKPGHRPLLVQTTSGSNAAARLKKIEESPLLNMAMEWGDVVIHGWRKVKVKRGGKAERWAVKETILA